MDDTNEVCFSMSCLNLDRAEGWHMWLAVKPAALLLCVCRHVTQASKLIC